MFDSWESELAHYGTKGQKWGVRHWQNEDGTFNEAGKERYFGPNGMEKPQTQHKTTPKANGQHKMTAAEQAEYDKRIKEASEAYSKLKDGSKTTEKKTEAKPSEEKKKEYVPKDTGKSSGKKGRKKKKKDKDKTAKEKKAKTASKARLASSSGSSMKSHSVKKAVSRGHHLWETSGAIKESSMNKPVVRVINTFSQLG